MIAIVDTGSGNLKSVAKALAHVGGTPVITRDPDQIVHASHVVVPGQGAFGDCARGLADGLGEAVREAIAKGTPYLGICLGMQVLFEGSDEDGGRARGLGVLAGRVVKLQAAPKIKLPHMGWNEILVRRLDPLWPSPPGSHAYFVHSFVCAPADPSVTVLEAEHGQKFCAAVRKDNVFACQFHPEKSQGVGLALLAAFVGNS